MARLSGRAATSRPRDLPLVGAKPVRFRSLPTPEARPAPAERRDAAGRELLVHRIRAEFLEMPGLRLTLTQAARLFGAPEEACKRIMAALIVEGFLAWTTDGRYARYIIGP